MRTSRLKSRGMISCVLVAALFFLVVATTFTSLGVVLPAMITSMGWSWTSAGTGFTLLALFCGLSSTAPSWVMRRTGIRATLLLGAGMMIAAFLVLAFATGLVTYYIGTSLLGIGFSFCSTVPGVTLIGRLMEKRTASAIGLYFTIGGLGGVVGPFLVTGALALFGDWRAHWIASAVLMLALAAAIALLLEEPPAMAAADSGDADDNVTRPHAWTLKEAARTWQFYMIVAGLTATLFCGVTINSWAVTHLTQAGIAATAAAGALSAQAAFNALSRGVAGFVAERINVKWLLVGGLALDGVGILSLAAAKGPALTLLFAVGSGAGYGIVFFATTLLLINYFGKRHNPEILGFMQLITTIAMLGPLLGGLIGDRFGSFAPLFHVYGLCVALLALAASFMAPPRPAQAGARDGRHPSTDPNLINQTQETIR